MPLCGAYVEYPLPMECGTCAMATGINKMVGPHIESFLTPWMQTASPTLSWVCSFCNKSHNSRDSLMNHFWLHYQIVLVCPVCGGCGSNQWRTVKEHVKKYAKTHPNVASWKVKPGKPLWRRSDLPLMNHTMAPEAGHIHTTSVARSSK